MAYEIDNIGKGAMAKEADLLHRSIKKFKQQGADFEANSENPIVHDATFLHELNTNGWNIPLIQGNLRERKG